MEIENGNVENGKVENGKVENDWKAGKNKIILIDLENNKKLIGDSVFALSQLNKDMSYYSLRQLFTHQNIKKIKHLTMMMNIYNKKYKIFVEKV